MAIAEIISLGGIGCKQILRCIRNYRIVKDNNNNINSNINIINNNNNNIPPKNTTFTLSI